MGSISLMVMVVIMMPALLVTMVMLAVVVTMMGGNCSVRKDGCIAVVAKMQWVGKII